MEEEKEMHPPEMKELPIEWHVKESLIPPFATNMIVHQTETEFKLYFFQVNASFRFGPSDPIPTKIRADCVASVIVTADRIPKFIKALQEQFEKYLSLKEKINEKISNP